MPPVAVKYLKQKSKQCEANKQAAAVQSEYRVYFSFIFQPGILCDAAADTLILLSNFEFVE